MDRVEQYDFWYSKKQEKALKKSKQHPYVESRFKGKVYTEMTSKGRKPISSFGDLKFLGTGANEDITFNR